MTQPVAEAETQSYMAPGDGGWQSLVAKADADKEKKEEVKRAQDALNAMLLTSLQMPHVVVLAGCGTSIAAGGPSMDGLWESAIGDTPTAEIVKAAKSLNYDISVVTNRNIESLLSRAEAYLRVNEADASIQAFLNTSKSAILAECSGFIDKGDLSAHQTFIHRLSRRRIRDQRLAIFTTNYDLCFERAASELGGVVLDGFSFTTPRHYDPRFFAYDIIKRQRSGDDVGHYVEGVFLLYKLHGSVNWARNDAGVIREKEKPTPEEACLIYPASGKYQQSYVQPYLESMGQYLAAVREPNTCLLVVGFGFNDNHLSEPLLAAARSNPNLRIVIVNKEAKKKATAANGNCYWPQLFDISKRGEDVWFINVTFSEFADMIPDLKSLTPADALVKALRSAARES